MVDLFLAEALRQLKMATDIRDKRQLSQTDILNLNFIKNPCPFFSGGITGPDSAPTS